VAVAVEGRPWPAASSMILRHDTRGPVDGARAVGRPRRQTLNRRGVPGGASKRSKRAPQCPRADIQRDDERTARKPAGLEETAVSLTIHAEKRIETILIPMQFSWFKDEIDRTSAGAEAWRYAMGGTAHRSVLATGHGAAVR